jgi:hypothetical protein
MTIRLRCLRMPWTCPSVIASDHKAKDPSTISSAIHLQGRVVKIAVLMLCRSVKSSALPLIRLPCRYQGGIEFQGMKAIPHMRLGQVLSQPQLSCRTLLPKPAYQVKPSIRRNTELTAMHKQMACRTCNPLTLHHLHTLPCQFR